MTPGTDRDAVFVEARGRLHFGVLDLGGRLGRWFGGIGAAAPTSTILISASRAADVEVEGADGDRARSFARRVLAHHGIEGGVRLSVLRALPAHAGLGSGTQLALAVARAVAELYGFPTTTEALAEAAGRGHRSAIGSYAFAGGGFIVEGGQSAARDGLPPLLVRVPFPPAWRCVVALPRAAAGLNGSAEQEAFDDLPLPPARDVERVAHLVLMGLLPSLAEGDLRTFGDALSAVQSITGGWFASVQGGTFAPGPSGELVRSMKAWGAAGVGQSSWGPAVYGVVDGEDAARWLASRVRKELGEGGSVYEGPFPVRGARVWRGPFEGLDEASCTSAARRGSHRTEAPPLH